MDIHWGYHIGFYTKTRMEYHTALVYLLQTRQPSMSFGFCSVSFLLPVIRFLLGCVWQPFVSSNCQRRSCIYPINLYPLLIWTRRSFTRALGPALRWGHWNEHHRRLTSLFLLLCSSTSSKRDTTLMVANRGVRSRAWSNGVTGARALPTTECLKAERWGRRGDNEGGSQRLNR